MRVGLLETDGTLVWQSRLAHRAECRLWLDISGLRCMSSRETLATVAKRLKAFPVKLVFMGSGAFHHLALPLIAQQAAKGPLSVLVFDRHLDCLSAPEGFVSCGSWIREAVKLPAVRQVVVIGTGEKMFFFTPEGGRFNPSGMALLVFRCERLF